MSFKKIHEDEHSATLMHKDGHQFKVAKAGLSPKMKNMLGSIPMHNYAYGTPDEPIGNTTPGPDGLVYGKDYTTETPQSQVDQMIADKTNQMPQQEIGRAPSSLWEKLTSVNPAREGEYIHQLSQEQPQRIPNQVPTESAKPETQSPVNAPIAFTPKADIPMSNSGVIPAYNQAFAQEASGVRQKSEAEQGLAKNQVAAADQQAKYMQDVMQGHQKNMDLLNQEIQHTTKDIENGHIDPNHYMNSKTTAGKISSAIGLILGGISAGLTGQKNPALEFLQQQIQHDVNSQKENLANKQNVLSSYFKQTGNLHDATAMTQAFYTNLYMNQLEKAKAQAATPMAKANADMALGQLNKMKEDIIAPIAYKNSVMGATNGIADPAMKLRAYTTAGIMSPKQSEDATKELTKAMEVEKLRANFQSSFDDLNHKVLAGKLSPADRDSAYQAFAGPIAKMAEGRFNLQEAENQAKALLPGLEGSETRANKQRRLDQFFDSFRNEPTMDAFQIKVGKKPRQGNY